MSESKSSGYLKVLGKTKMHFILIDFKLLLHTHMEAIILCYFLKFLFTKYINLSAEGVTEVSLEEEQRGDDDDDGIAHQQHLVRKHFVSHLVFYCL